MRVVVLHDAVPEGAPPDQLDTLVQVAAVEEALRADGHRVERLAFDGDPAPLLARAPELVFNLVESVGGDGKLVHLAPAMLSLLGLPFTGAGVAAMALTTDKRLTKRFLAARGQRVPEDWPAGGPRYIVKSRWEDASLGLSDENVVDHAEVPAAIARLSLRLGGGVVAETFLDGRELNVSVIETPDGPVALPVAEIRFDLPPGRERIVGYAAKWSPDSEEYAGTHRTFEVHGLDLDDLAARSVACFRALSLRGYARVDWRAPPDGSPAVLEVNANPCLSPDAGFAAAAARAGWSFERVVRAIVAAAVPGPARTGG